MPCSEDDISALGDGAGAAARSDIVAILVVQICNQLDGAAERGHVVHAVFGYGRQVRRVVAALRGQGDRDCSAHHSS